MFIKQSVFEKLIKKAYKEYMLRIYKSKDDDLIIDTPNWTLGIHKDFITFIATLVSVSPMSGE